jgi:hypothetical protein
VAVYEPGKLWEQAPPAPAATGAPVVRAINGTGDEIKQLLPEAIAHHPSA